MPELPEVEVVRRGLAPHVDGRVITRVDVHEPRSLRRQIGGPDAFVQAVTGARVARLERRGKFLWWRLQDERGDELGEALMTHLGMSGQMRVRGGAPEAEDGGEADAGTVAPSAPAPRGEGPASDPHRHRRIVLHLDDGAQVDFVDQRIFGGLWTSALEQDADGLPATPDSIDDLLPADVVGIGRDLLDPAQDREAVIAVMRARRAPIKALLLDQSLVSGIGNIYADEGLWAARTRFDAPGESLTRGRARRVLDGAEAVMRRALDVGGTSFDDLYVNVDGRSGYLDIDVERVEGSRAHEGRDCLCRASAMRRQAILRSDLARRALDKQLNGPAHLVAHRHKVGSRSLRGVACA